LKKDADANCNAKFRVDSLAAYRIAVALALANFLLFFLFGLKKTNKQTKTKENSHALKRQLYAYAANESTLKQQLVVKHEEFFAANANWHLRADCTNKNNSRILNVSFLFVGVSGRKSVSKSLCLKQ